MVVNKAAGLLKTREVLSKYLSGETSHVEKRSAVIGNLNRIDIPDFHNGVDAVNNLLTIMKTRQNDSVWCRTHQVYMQRILMNYGAGISWESILMAFKVSMALFNDDEGKPLSAETIINCTEQLFEEFGIDEWIRDHGGYENMPTYGEVTQHASSSESPKPDYNSSTPVPKSTTAETSGTTSTTQAYQDSLSLSPYDNYMQSHQLFSDSPEQQPDTSDIKPQTPLLPEISIQPAQRNPLTTRDVLSTYILGETSYMEQQSPVFRNLHLYDVKSFKEGGFDMQEFTYSLEILPTFESWSNMHKVHLHRVVFNCGISITWDNILMALKVAKLLSEYEGNSTISAEDIINCTVAFFSQHNIDDWIANQKGYENMPIYKSKSESDVNKQHDRDRPADLDESEELKAAFNQLGFYAESPPTDTGKSTGESSNQRQPIRKSPASQTPSPRSPLSRRKRSPTDTPFSRGEQYSDTLERIVSNVLHLQFQNLPHGTHFMRRTIEVLTEYSTAMLWCQYHQALLAVEVFREGQGITWSNILLAIKLAQLVKTYPMVDNQLQSEEIVDCYVEFFNQHLEHWIAQNGGWEMMPWIQPLTGQQECPPGMNPLNLPPPAYESLPVEEKLPPYSAVAVYHSPPRPDQPSTSDGNGSRQAPECSTKQSSTRPSSRSPRRSPSPPAYHGGTFQPPL